MSNTVENAAGPKAGAAPLISVRSLTKRYQSGSEDLTVLNAIDLDVYPGEMTAIMGPSGTGKSTLLFILGLLQPASDGEYHAMGQNVFALTRSRQAAFRRESVGFVFQSANMFEYSNVYENLEYPLIYSGVKRSRRPGMIKTALERVNMSHRMHHPANRLSGGEQQRVAIARALVNEPRVILADEPTGQLDSKNGRQVMDHFHHLTSDNKTAIILVTHDPGVAQRCHRVFHLDDGKIRVEVNDPGPIHCEGATVE